MADASVPAVGAIAHQKPRVRSRRFRRIIRNVPLFTYLFIIYVVIELLANDVRAPMFHLGSYALSWVEVIHGLAAVIAMSELLRVSKPGIDNTKEALWMLGVGVLYLVIFIFSITGVSFLSIFNRTEFLYLCFLSGAQVVLAFMINARTLKRTIDNTGYDDASGPPQ